MKCKSRTYLTISRCVKPKHDPPCHFWSHSVIYCRLHFRQPCPLEITLIQIIYFPNNLFKILIAAWSVLTGNIFINKGSATFLYCTEVVRTWLGWVAYYEFATTHPPMVDRFRLLKHFGSG